MATQTMNHQGAIVLLDTLGVSQGAKQPESRGKVFLLGYRGEMGVLSRFDVFVTTTRIQVGNHFVVGVFRLLVDGAQNGIIHPTNNGYRGSQQNQNQDRAYAHTCNYGKEFPLHVSCQVFGFWVENRLVK